MKKLYRNGLSWTLYGVGATSLLYLSRSDNRTHESSKSKLLAEFLPIYHKYLRGEYSSALFNLYTFSKNKPQLSLALHLLESGEYETAAKKFDDYFADQEDEIKYPYYLIRLSIADALSRRHDLIIDWPTVEELIQPHITELETKDKSLRYNRYLYDPFCDYDATTTVTRTKSFCETLLSSLKAYKGFISDKRIIELDKFIYNQFPYLYFENIGYDSKNTVIVRVWLPINKGDVGHASLSTNKYYISFWPNENNIFEKNKGKNIESRTLDQDIFDEGRIPDVKALFYDFDTDKIHEYYKAFLNSNAQWSIFGSLCAQDQNCCGLTRELLFIGDKNGLFRGSMTFATLDRSALFWLSIIPISSLIAILSSLISLTTLTPTNVAKMIKTAEAVQRVKMNMDTMNMLSELKCFESYDIQDSPQLYFMQLQTWAEFSIPKLVCVLNRYKLADPFLLFLPWQSSNSNTTIPLIEQLIKNIREVYLVQSPYKDVFEKRSKSFD